MNTIKIINADVEFITPIDGAAILKRLEQCGRVCYKSEAKITDTSAPAFVAGIIKRGHEAVLEHCSFTVKFICDRGVSHEIVRHRMASYCQESTRYCNYGKEDFGSEITVIKPCFMEEGSAAWDIWKDTCRCTEEAYFDLLNFGCTPQEARSVLPNSLKTEVVMTANMREWRHFLKLRCSPAAHPQMREVALILLDKVHSMIPVCFDDIWSEYHEQG
jgi:thymidylate synthase (FAD)|nr:MAG TPA: Thymidylate synthase complementing protein [Caudoviricetes sp.]